MRKVLLFVLLAIFISQAAFAKDPMRIMEGVVMKVVDGDTCTVNSDGTKMKIRLYGIDSPETEKRNKKTGKVSKPGQRFGSESCQVLEGKIGGQRVRLDIMDIDNRYHRMVAIVRLDNQPGNGGRGYGLGI